MVTVIEDLEWYRNKFAKKELSFLLNATSFFLFTAVLLQIYSYQHTQANKLIKGHKATFFKHVTINIDKMKCVG